MIINGIPNQEIDYSPNIQGTNYTLQASDDVVYCSGTATFTLPAFPRLGKTYRVKLVVPNAVCTVAAAALIDGVASTTITTQYNAIDFHWDGATWHRLAVTMSNTRMGQVNVDFGFASGGEGDTAFSTVAATWVQATSIVLAQAAATATADHDPEDAVVEGLVAAVTNIIPGVSFDILAYAPFGTWGQYTFLYQGLIVRSASPV